MGVPKDPPGPLNSKKKPGPNRVKGIDLCFESTELRQ